MKIQEIKNKPNFLVGGGLFASILASTCCVGPLVLTLLGISGSATLSRIEPIRIPMMIAVAILFIIAGVKLYKPLAVCEPGSLCADSIKLKKMKIIYWLGLIIAVLVLTSPQWLPLIFL